MKAANEDKKVEVTVATSAGATTVVDGSEMGDVKIHENVIASLVRQAALQQEGVSRLAGSALVDDIASLVGSRRMQARAIAVELGEEGTVGIEIKLNLIFGYRIPEVAERVQKAVIAVVEDTTGMTVTKVNILVQEIEDPIVEEEAADAADDGEAAATISLN